MLHPGARVPLVLFALSVAFAGQVSRPGVDRQLFVDDEGIAESEGLRRVIHPVTKYEDNPIVLPVKPWEGQYTLLYGTVLRDDEEGVWKMWYSTMNHFRYGNNLFPESTYLCYAISQDGIHWRKPPLGIVDYRGTRENNIVLEGTHAPGMGIEGILDSVSVLKDKHDPDPSRRYKLMIWRHNQKFEGAKHSYVLTGPHRMGYYVAFSADGLDWNEKPEPVFTYNPVRDTMSLMWDPRTSRYLAYLKEQLNGKRARFLSESEDFLHWSTPVPMLAADSLDPPDVELYANTAFPYEGMYLGLMTVFHPSPLDNIFLDIQLISSRDARKWQRVGDRTPIIPVGRRNIDWDFGFNSPATGPPIRVGDELWFYYSGRSYRHPVDRQGREPNKGAIGLAKLRLDGFVSMDASQKGGMLTTVPLKFDLPALFINADASHGQIRVEVLDEKGSVIRGYRASDCLPLRRDGVRQRVHWRDASDLTVLAGKTVRFKFYLQNASIYSFWVGAL